MEEKDIHVFECSICHTQYDDKAEAEKCEEECAQRNSISSLREHLDQRIDRINNSYYNLAHEYIDNCCEARRSKDFWVLCSIFTWITVGAVSLAFLISL